MKTLIALVAALATALLVSSCTTPSSTSSDGHTDHTHGSESSAAAPNDAPNNAADVAFVSGMIPHHEQAVEMSALVPQRSTNPEVIKLAADISAAQEPEIQTMKGFLAQWNAGEGDVQEGAGHEGHDMGAMTGMVDDGSMAKLETLKGAEFDNLWLTSMIGHHEGAVTMAKTEIADGANADAKALADHIVTVQQAEIAQMKKMVATS
jgi:uncharacterized protein (DUF305 family)